MISICVSIVRAIVGTAAALVIVAIATPTLAILGRANVVPADEDMSDEELTPAQIKAFTK